MLSAATQTHLDDKILDLRFHSPEEESEHDYAYGYNNPAQNDGRTLIATAGNRGRRWCSALFNF